MRARNLFVNIIKSLMLALLYYRLTVFLVGYSAAVAKPAWWSDLLPTMSPHAAALTWLEILNTAAMTLAALLTALAALKIFGARALAATAFSSAGVAVYSLSETIRVTSWAFTPNDFLIVLLTDTVKIVAIPVLLVLMLRHWASNLRCSGP